MSLHDLVGSTLIASDRDTDSFFFWDDRNSVFLVHSDQVQQTFQAGSLTHAHQVVGLWKKNRELRKQVNAFLWEAMKDHKSYLWDLQEEPGLVRVLYRNKADTATETVVASDWSEMLTKLRERFGCRDHRQAPLLTDVSPHDPCALLNPDDYVIGGGAIGRHSCRPSRDTCKGTP